MRQCTSCGATFSAYQRKCCFGAWQIDEKVWFTHCRECLIDLVNALDPVLKDSKSTRGLNVFSESEIKELLESMSPFNYGTGGGQRVIRSTNTFGG